MASPNITAMLQALSPASRGGSAATGSFSFVSGNSGTSSRGGGATRSRLVRTDEHGSQSKCRHLIGSSGSEKVCFVEKAEGVETCGTNHQGDEVAVEANALYILIARKQILSSPFIPCSILAESYVEELLSDPRELVDWQTLFVDILRASEDSSHATVDAAALLQWQESIQMPLRTPGRIRTRLMASPSEDSEISGEPQTPTVLMPDTPDVDVDFNIDPEAFSEWKEAGLPFAMVDALHAMEQGLDKANLAVLGLHRDFGAMGAVMADDIHALDCRLQSLRTTVGNPKSIPGVVAANLWEAVSVMGSRDQQAPRETDSSAADTQTRLGSLAAGLTFAKQETSALRAEKDALGATVSNLERQLGSTLEIAIDLRGRLDGLAPAPPVGTRNIGPDRPHIGDVYHQVPILQGARHTGPGLENAVTDQISRAEFLTTVGNLRAEIALLKKQGANKGSINCFPDLLPGVQSLEDVHSWVVANFGGAQGGGGGDEGPETSIWDDVPSGDIAGPTFGPFCDIYVLLAVAEDLDSIMSKGDTLKEMDYIQKAGIKHPAEAVVIYSLKRAVPGIFGEGLGAGGKSFLPKLKNAADWESILSNDANAKPGLRDILSERHEAIEAMIRGHIHDAFTSKGFGKAAELAKEMLAASVKLLKLLMDYITTVYRKLVELSGFLPEDAWSLTTQVVRGIFIYLSNVRSKVRAISPRDSPTKNTAKVLYTLLRTHVIMTELVQHEIKNHPIVSSEYVKFLAAHSPNGEVRKLREELKVTVLLVKSAQAEAKKAITIANEAVKKSK